MTFKRTRSTSAGSSILSTQEPASGRDGGTNDLTSATYLYVRTSASCFSEVVCTTNARAINESINCFRGCCSSISAGEARRRRSCTTINMQRSWLGLYLVDSIHREQAYLRLLFNIRSYSQPNYSSHLSDENHITESQGSDHRFVHLLLRFPRKR